MDYNNSVYFFRMQDGGDLIAEMTITEYNGEEVLSLHNPMRIIYTENGNGMLAVTLYPWVFPHITEDMQFDINNRDIVVKKIVSSSMENYYRKAVKEHTSIASQLFEKIEKNIDEYLKEDTGKKVSYH